jgi:hypothetical protein
MVYIEPIDAGSGGTSESEVTTTSYTPPSNYSSSDGYVGDENDYDGTEDPDDGKQNREYTGITASLGDLTDEVTGETSDRDDTGASSSYGDLTNLIGSSIGSGGTNFLDDPPEPSGGGITGDPDTNVFDGGGITGDPDTNVVEESNIPTNLPSPELPTPELNLPTTGIVAAVALMVGIVFASNGGMNNDSN